MRHFTIEVLALIHMVLFIWVCIRAIHFFVKFKRWPFLVTEVSFLAYKFFGDGIVANLWPGFNRPPWIIENFIYALGPVAISSALIARLLPQRKWAIWLFGYGAILIGACLFFPFFTILELNDLIIVLVFSQLAYQCFQISTKYIRGLIDLNFAFIYFFGILIFILSKNVTAEYWGNSYWLHYFACINFVAHISFLYLLLRVISQQFRNQASPESLQ